MSTRTPIGRATELPDVGVKADWAIQMLRELGLMPITWSAGVEELQASFVLDLEPHAGSPEASITVSVAAHPDFQGHADDSLAGHLPAKESW